MTIKENHILNLGSEEFTVKRIISSSSLSESLSSSSDIKIIDFDDDSDWLVLNIDFTKSIFF